MMSEYDEYVQMMICAGWIDASTLDEEYQFYIERYTHSNQHPMDMLDYDDWKSLADEWRSLDSEFRDYEQMLGVGVFGDPNVNVLIKRLTTIEIYLCV